MWLYFENLHMPVNSILNIVASEALILIKDYEEGKELLSNSIIIQSSENNSFIASRLPASKLEDMIS